MELSKSGKGRHFEEDSNARISVQEQGCLVNPSVTASSTQDLLVPNQVIQRSMEMFTNCLRVALQASDQQDKEVGNSNNHHAEFCTLVLIQSIRLVQLCRHTNQEDYRAHFVQVLQRTISLEAPDLTLYVGGISSIIQTVLNR
ncbi:uncharacterized protein LOC144691547 [Cetorhinus maximus]